MRISQLCRKMVSPTDDLVSQISCDSCIKIWTFNSSLKIQTSHSNTSQHQTPWSDAWGEKYNDGSPLPTRIHANRSISIITLGIPTVETIMEYALLGAAWKRPQHHANNRDQWRGRPQIKKLHYPDQWGHLAKTSESLLTKAWNRLPFETKNSTNFTSIKSQLKSLLYWSTSQFFISGVFCCRLFSIFWEGRGILNYEICINSQIYWQFLIYNHMPDHFSLKLRI